MQFINENHEAHYEKYANSEMDSHTRALIYTLGINDDTRRHFLKIYDLKKREIDINALHAGWQTSGSVRVTRMAFNLFTGAMPTLNVEMPKNEIIQEAKQYSVDELFAGSYGAYFIEAIKIRYPRAFSETSVFADLLHHHD